MDQARILADPDPSKQNPKGEQLLGGVAELRMYESIHQASNSGAQLYAHAVAHQ